MILPPSYSIASRGHLTVAYRRCTVRDRLQVASWAQAWREGLAAGLLTADLEAGELLASCEAMAARLVAWPLGVGYTDSKLLELHGSDPQAWAWLYGLLYWPAATPRPDLEALASALQMAPTVGGGCPGDPAATDCATCLLNVHEAWDPEHGQTGQPIAPMPYVRQLGDAQCEACPKWALPGRPTIGIADIELARLRLTGALPDAGGILDQEADTWDRLELIARSPWFAVWGPAHAHQ